jgi:hypothetical protein
MFFTEREKLVKKGFLENQKGVLVKNPYQYQEFI